ncbi:SHOCT domain-containing protein [Streptomyces sp. NPDC049627]|uniref:SHOCT domain-containing protein n=1 Tax=Streptomyces sp. NPDC049627 TaxID=3365595 RepID=UPI00378BED9F
MMFWYAHGVSGWGWFGMSVGMILFWTVIIAALVLLFRAVNGPHEHTHTTPAAPTPEQILGERFARGEIDEEEYRRRLDALHAGPLTKS